jgi:predicted type IV restriction endonuclease
VRRFQGRNLGEQNTKASLIEPLLEALGWDVRDPDEVDREFKAAPKDAPVDYGLLVMRTPRLLVEAKGLGEDLSDRRWVGQTIGYASVAGAAWCVLTDGDEYRLYNTTVAVDAEEKLFCSIRLSDGDEDEAVEGLLRRAVEGPLHRPAHQEGPRQEGPGELAGTPEARRVLEEIARDAADPALSQAARGAAERSGLRRRPM